MVPRPQPLSGGARPRRAGLGRLPTGPAGLRQALALGGLGGGQGSLDPGHGAGAMPHET